MKDAEEPVDADDSLSPELPPELAAALTGFERYLRAERSLSPHTVRAYIGDVTSLLQHVGRNGIQVPGDLDLAQLRSWLAVQHESGAARASLARRGAAARTFTAFAHRRGWLAIDPGPRLGTLKTRRTLPHVLRQDEMKAVLDAAARHAAAPPEAEARSRSRSRSPGSVSGRDRRRGSRPIERGRRGPARLRGA
jgi:integrase/recombinase XerC